MKIRCCCGNLVDDSLEKCPNPDCGCDLSDKKHKKLKEGAITSFKDEELLAISDGCALIQATNPRTNQPMHVAVNSLTTL